MGAYDRATPLILDPAMLVNRGYIGGSEDDVGYDIAIDSQGCAYITGYTSSTEATFPASGGLEYLI